MFVDDDSFALRPFTTECSLRGMEVKQVDLADDVLPLLEDTGGTDLLVLDVMLGSNGDSGLFTRENTYDFYYTGLVLAHAVRARSFNMPILLFSMGGLASFVDTINRVAALIGNCAYAKKHQFNSTIDFGDLVETILSGGLAEIARNRNWQKIFDAIVLKPSFAGVGIDIKRLF